jgi:hypothetical protein
VCGDVVRIVKETPREFSVAYLDFCQPLSASLLKCIESVMTFGMANDSHLGVAFLGGREQGAMRDQILKVKSNVQNEVFLYTAKKNRVTSTSRDAPAARFSYLSRHLYDACPNVFSSSKNLFYYNSNTKEAKGVPICVYLGRITRRMVGQSEKKFRLSRLLAKAKATATFTICDMTEEDLRDYAFEILDQVKDKDVITKEIFEKNMHLLLNISKGTVAAWKAHRTRGTYNKETDLE